MIFLLMQKSINIPKKTSLDFRGRTTSFAFCRGRKIIINYWFHAKIPIEFYGPISAQYEPGVIVPSPLAIFWKISKKSSRIATLLKATKGGDRIKFFSHGFYDFGHCRISFLSGWFSRGFPTSSKNSSKNIF